MHTLLQVKHGLFHAPEKSNIARISSVEFIETFDMTDHSSLMQKFIASGLPSGVA
jgi:hypothetical protein